MDLEKARKVNELMGELKKHKLFTGDPLASAEKIVLDGDSLPKESETKRVEKQFEYLLSESNRKIKEEFEFLRDNLLKLSGELNALKEEVRVLRSRPEQDKVLVVEESEPVQKTLTEI